MADTLAGNESVELKRLRRSERVARKEMGAAKARVAELEAERTESGTLMTMLRSTRDDLAKKKAQLSRVRARLEELERVNAAAMAAAPPPPAAVMGAGTGPAPVVGVGYSGGAESVVSAAANPGALSSPTSPIKRTLMAGKARALLRAKAAAKNRIKAAKLAGKSSSTPTLLPKIPGS